LKRKKRRIIREKKQDMGRQQSKRLKIACDRKQKEIDRRSEMCVHNWTKKTRKGDWVRGLLLPKKLKAKVPRENCPGAVKKRDEKAKRHENRGQGGKGIGKGTLALGKGGEG